MKLKGIVVKGKGRGVGLGFPTANIELDGPLPEFGIYAVWVYWKGTRLKGALSCGPAYTFNETKPTLEVFILDFKSDLYGQEIQIEIVKKIRDMEKFDSSEKLSEQIKKDCEEIRKILK